MSLSDLMGHAGLAVFAEIGMILFFIAFLGIAWWVFRPANRKRWVTDAKMPLDDVHPQQPRDLED